MQTQVTVNAITGVVIGGLLALVVSLVVVATAGPGGEVLPTTPALMTLAGGIAGGLIGLFNRR